VGALYNREVSIVVDTLRITGLRVAFKVVQTDQPSPNTVECSIYNLSADSRAKLQSKRSIRTIIEAGYTSNLGLLFSGDLRRAFSSSNGVDWVTTFRAGDGEAALRTARINESFSPGTPIKTVLNRLAGKLGVKPGDSSKYINAAVHNKAQTQFTSGTVVSGPTWPIFESYLSAYGLTFSVQDGNLQVLPLGQASTATAVKLTPRTGLIGSPEAGEKGKLKCKSLLQPSIRPGRKIFIQSTQINGFYRVETVSHIGDTHGEAWHSDIEAVPL
jgi:hypothetical protein